MRKQAKHKKEERRPLFDYKKRRRHLSKTSVGKPAATSQLERGIHLAARAND